MRHFKRQITYTINDKTSSREEMIELLSKTLCKSDVKWASKIVDNETRRIRKRYYDKFSLTSEGNLLKITNQYVKTA